MATEAVHLIAHGRVQGVFYRASTKARADELGLTGWVKNRPDQTVEIHAEGPRDSLERFIEWCGQGPPAAQVTELEQNWVTPETMTSFEIAYP